MNFVNKTIDPIKWIDSHCHLDYEPMSNDIEKVFQNMKTHQVVGAMSISTTIGTLDKTYSYLRDNLWFAVGVHPLDERIEDIQEIESYLSEWIGRKNVVSIGECGLDGFKGSNLKKQFAGFDIQLAYAHKHKLPLVLHMRDAEDDAIAMIKKYDGIKGIAHCYTGSMEFAKKVLDLGWMISFSGIITFKNANQVREIAQFVPLDRILIETDAPYLAPAPHRGKSNEPAFVSYVGKYIAQLKNIDEAEFAQITGNNFCKLMNVKCESFDG
ncbi:TatD family hydrolase [Candidatus Cytomitobacter indipagum]|nr:TatD family hydrolase [Candidatus Cytomitobacter indipagum]